jgi:hypothetical protein
MEEVDKILNEPIEKTVIGMLHKVVSSETLAAVVQYKVTRLLWDAIGVLSANFVKQSDVLKECAEKAKDDFVNESKYLRESMEEIRSSLEKFRVSAVKSSNALTRATYVLAGVAFIQAVIFVLQWVK